MGARLVEQIFTALDAQTVVVPGTTATETILPKLANSPRELLKQGEELAGRIEGMLDARRSNTSICGEHPPKGGNKQLKRALFRSAFAALSDPLSRALRPQTR
ncbi:hypothetical protein [Actinoplanes sp. NPDC048796]|uniref:hypothetical protein n=1 Tax=Actinoplanes sp. NPDC048796 TaxID=3155640 RepID=UPI0033D9F93D